MQRLVFLVLAGLACGATAVVNAQPYPGHPVRLVVPFPPGGAIDTNARALARAMEGALGQPFIVDNRGGANGIIAYDLVAKAAPDGYTLLQTSVGFVINAGVYKKLPFNITTDFTPITNALMGQGLLMVINPALPAANLKEFIAYAKTKPLAYGSPGIGNALHIIAEGFNARAGTGMSHIPYKGAGPAMNALLAGEVQVLFVPPAVAAQYLPARRLRALGYTGDKRVDFLPDVPTISEAGLAGFNMSTGWHAWFAPAKTPAIIVKKIHAALRGVLQEPKLREFFVNSGYEPVADAPAEFARSFQQDIKRWGELVRTMKIQPD